MNMQTLLEVVVLASPNKSHKLWNIWNLGSPKTMIWTHAKEVSTRLGFRSYIMIMSFILNIYNIYVPFVLPTHSVVFPFFFSHLSTTSSVFGRTRRPGCDVRVVGLAEVLDLVAAELSRAHGDSERGRSLTQTGLSGRNTKKYRCGICSGHAVRKKVEAVEHEERRKHSREVGSFTLN